MGASAGGGGSTDNPQAVKPVDSATLIIVDTASGEPRILMGRRAMDSVFMPGKYVFPGGRVDRIDRTIESADELAAHEEAKLLIEMRGNPSAARARAIALAAVRETFEEAGLLLGAPRPGAAAAPEDAGGWCEFFAQGYAPRLSPLTFFARAITPPGRPRRFDSRFFYAHASAIAHRVDKNDGELSSLDWFTIEEIRGLDLPAITRVVIEDLVDRLKLDGLGRGATSDVPIPFYRHKNGTSRRQLLTLANT